MKKTVRRNFKLPSQTMLLTMFAYNGRSGILRRRSGARFHRCGRKVSIGNQDLWSARIVWKMMTGRDPVDVIGFVDGDPSNLRWTNLTELTHAQLRLRGDAHVTNKTGYRGVYRTKDGKYRSQIRYKGKKYYCGTHNTMRRAADARTRMRVKILRGEIK